MLFDLRINLGVCLGAFMYTCVCAHAHEDTHVCLRICAFAYVRVYKHVSKIFTQKIFANKKQTNKNFDDSILFFSPKDDVR